MWIISNHLYCLCFQSSLQAQGFHIDYLSKVPLVKDTVHKQSLLYHAVQNVMEKFPDSTDLFSELGSMSRCAKVGIRQSITIYTGRVKK